MDEHDNLAAAGTDAVEPSDADTAPEWDFYDPDDEQGTEEAQPSDAPDDEDAAEPPSEEDGQEEAPAVYADEKAKVKLADGSEVAVGELIKGHLRQADYTRKSMAVAEQRKHAEAQASQLEGVLNAFTDFLASQIPDEPSPALALRNPGEYTAQKAQREAALAQVQKLIDLGRAPKQIKSAMTQEAHRELLATENARLADLFPETGTQPGREKFFGNVRAAAEAIGFTAQELSQATDHRLFALAHWAQKGMAAEKAAAAAKAKAAKAPPAMAPKPGAAGDGRKNRDAMKRLSRTGSMRDALAIDWE